MGKKIWKITMISSIIGALLLIITIFGASGAPQEAAGASIAVAFAVIPYCIARSISEIKKINGTINDQE